MGLVQVKIEADMDIETSPQLIESLHMARQVAIETGAALVLPEHLQLAMLEDDESSFLLEAYGVDFKKVRARLAKAAKKNSQPAGPDQQAVFSPQAEAIMQHAREQARKNALGEVDSNLVLAVMLSEKSSLLEKLLAPHDLDMSGVLQYLELREGKTVTIDPLPPLPLIAPVVAGAPASKTNNETSSKPVALAVTNEEPSKAPAKEVAPLFETSAPMPPQANAPAVPQPQQPQQPPAAPVPAPAQPVPPIKEATTTPSLQAAAPTPAEQAPAQEMAQAAPTPTAAPPAMPSSPPTPESAPRQSHIPLAQQITQTTANGNDKTDAAAPQPAPSKLRGLFGRLKRKDKKPDQGKAETLTSPDKTMPQAPETVPPNAASAPVTPANNNQARPDSDVRPPQPTAWQSAGAPIDQPPLPEQPQTIEALHNSARQQNRPAKRRRTLPDSLGAHESLSATGSVLEKGRLVEKIPRHMKVNRPSRAEVRITRAQMDEINGEFESFSSSHIHELAVTEAMTVQLRAPGSGFHIENLSPQTQWIDRNQRHVNDADFGAWRWNVTPTRSGKARLQLVISARTVDEEGNIHIADIPDKIIELTIARDHGKMVRNTGIASLVALAGLILGRYGESFWHWLSHITGLTG